jgi:alpha-ketoglutarate-dependent taurine dioxygenase
VTHQTTQLNRIGFDDIGTPVFSSALDEVGYVYVDGIPESFDHAEFLRTRLGPLLPQYDGQTVWSIRPDQRFEGTYHSLNSRRLTPHTECYEWQDAPPKYLALWCLVPNSDAGGQTTLADGGAFVASLDADERERLSQVEYHFVSSAGLQEMQLGRTARHPILEQRPGRSPILRFSCQCIADADEFCQDIGDRLQRFFDRTKVSVEFTARSLLIWDNHRFLHSRNAFTDPRRHLRRVWIAEQERTEQ